VSRRRRRRRGRIIIILLEKIDLRGLNEVRTLGMEEVLKRFSMAWSLPSIGREKGVALECRRSQ
jgi:hypothetical protein